MAESKYIYGQRWPYIYFGGMAAAGFAWGGDNPMLLKAIYSTADNPSSTCQLRLQTRDCCGQVNTLSF